MNAAMRGRSFRSRPSMPCRAASTAGAVLLAVALMLLFAVPASAGVSHAFKTTFGSATSTPPDPYPISGPTDVAVDQETHDVYVTDPGNHRVEKFDAQGHFLLMFGKEVDKTTKANVCTAASADECQAGVATEKAGGFEFPMYLAIDNYPFGGGDVYVGDHGDNLVSKFDSSGNLMTGWGVGGQKDGSDDPGLPIFGPLTALAVGGGCATPTYKRTGTCKPNGTLYVDGTQFNGNGNVREYTQGGEWIVDGFTGGWPWLKVSPEGIFYFPTQTPWWSSDRVIMKCFPTPGSEGECSEFQMTSDKPTAGYALDPSSEELYAAVGERTEGENHGIRVDHFSADCEPRAGTPCDPLDSFGEGSLTAPRNIEIEKTAGFNPVAPFKGVAVDGSNHTVYVVNSSEGEPNENDIAVFEDIRPIVTTGPPVNVRTSSVTLTGHVDPNGHADVNECYFEYGYDKNYGHTLPCSPDASANNYKGPTDVTATISNLSPLTREHYRLVASNTAGGSNRGADETFSTTAPPGIDGLTAENLTATSAELRAKVNPNGLPTRYTFEYGTSTSYGQQKTGSLTPTFTDQSIIVQLTELQPHAVYHYRLVAENKVEGKEEGGTTISEDHTFNFYPPSCPNENVRQQTAANYLPDCRAYELVSPSNANGTQLYPGGPNTGYATSPSRFSYTGLWSTIPEAGGNPADSTGDLYVATRTDTGWHSKYVGPPASEIAIAGGPPQGLFGQGTSGFWGNRTAQSIDGAFGTDIIHNNDFTDAGMNRFLEWNDGSPEGAFRNKTPTASNAPFVFSWDGRALDRWPTNLASVSAGAYPVGSNLWSNADYVTAGTEPLSTAPGGPHALDCRYVGNPGTSLAPGECPGEVSASSDLSHFVFSTRWNVFAPGGELNAPGSVYDNNTVTGTVTVASKTPAGDAIPNEPGDQSGDPLQIPAVSSDGSRILILAPAVGACGFSVCPTPPCGSISVKKHCATWPGRLYMRVDDAATYDVSMGHAVMYVGMTADASKVYFTSPEQLTNEDHDASVDLYMWSEAGEKAGKPLTLVSKGNNEGNPGEPGNSDACKASFTVNCGVLTYSNISFCQSLGGRGGNCRSDNSIASGNGDIYFLSPEQLDGSRGIPDKENLYDYRAGKAQFVATLEPGIFCLLSPIPGVSDESCTSGPVARMQVSPDDSHMAFATASEVTQYDNAKHLEVYLYDPSSRRILCASCIPSGVPPTSDVGLSEDGLFMTNDGRVFFTTEDALVHADSNEAQDVYEYVDGRPQLITTGTGETRTAALGFSALQSPPGLLGVSADGRDVYFSTFDTLVSQDHNGLFLKFYDARAGGGFPAPAPPPPCEAADECHGAGNSPPAPIAGETGAGLSGGDVSNVPRRKHHKGKHRRRPGRRHRARAARHTRGGSR